LKPTQVQCTANSNRTCI